MTTLSLNVLHSLHYITVIFRIPVPGVDSCWVYSWRRCSGSDPRPVTGWHPGTWRGQYQRIPAPDCAQNHHRRPSWGLKRPISEDPLPQIPPRPITGGHPGIWKDQCQRTLYARRRSDSLQEAILGHEEVSQNQRKLYSNSKPRSIKGGHPGTWRGQY